MASRILFRTPIHQQKQHDDPELQIAPEMLKRHKCSRLSLQRELKKNPRAVEIPSFDTGRVLFSPMLEQ